VRLEGSIDAFSLPDIFSLLSMTKKTGGLHLRRDTAHGVVWFTTGAVTGGAGDVATQSLTRRLIGAGVVSDDALTAAVQRAGDEGVGVGRALQLGGDVDEGVLHDLASEHIVDSVFDLLRWPDGDFAFVVDEPNPDDVGVSRQVEDVVTEARRRLEAWTGVATTVPSPQTVLSFAPNPPDDPHLSREDWTLLALVDGRRSVAEIVRLLGRGDFAVVSGLADLVGRGLLQTGEYDAVADLSRRLDLLGVAEAAQVVDSAPVVPEPTVAEPAPYDTAEPAPYDTADPAPYDADDTVEDEDDDELLANVDAPAEPAPTKPLAPVAPQPRTPATHVGVTPQRPEPVLPSRQPDFPEPAVPLAMAAGAGAPVPAPAIERDPNVNKSLLLRLIAGVRGL
jgi:hypothetical protein